MLCTNEHCTNVIPSGKRSHAIYCSKQCKQAAWVRRQRGRVAAALDALEHDATRTEVIAILRGADPRRRVV